MIPAIIPGAESGTFYKTRGLPQTYDYSLLTQIPVLINTEHKQTKVLLAKPIEVKQNDAFSMKLGKETVLTDCANESDLSVSLFCLPNLSPEETTAFASLFISCQVQKICSLLHDYLDNQQRKV